MRILLGGMTVFTAADVAIAYLDALGAGPSYLASQLPFIVPTASPRRGAGCSSR